MSPTSFFLLTLLLVLVTEATARGPREKFSQSADDISSKNSALKILESSRGSGSSIGESGSSFGEYSRSESSWSNFKSKTPSSFSSEKVHEESSSEMSSSGSSFGLKMRGSQGGEGMSSSFKTKVKSRISGK